MIKRTTEQWQALFEAHEQSGLSQARFCKEKKLCTKYFSLRKRQLASSENNPKFIRVSRSKPTAEMLDVEWQFQVGELKVRVLNASVEQMLGLIKGLA